jgi:hypothetical protein|tara:strand:+ start:157 stop:870 length:714 start_codon:yes stop_codon:yes gene_type:complete
MSITRLQQARQMYRYGGGADMGSTGSSTGSSGPAGGASAGGNYGGNSSGGTAPGGMSNTGGNKVDVGFQNAIRDQQRRQDTIDKSQDPNFGQFFGTRVPTYEPPTFGERLGQGVGNYIKGGGMIGMIAKGLGSLFGDLTSPKSFEDQYGYATDYQGSKSPSRVIDFGPEGGNDSNNQELYATTNQYTAPKFIEEEGIETLVNNPDFVQRFRVKNPYRQDKQGQLDPQIMEMISKLYT